MPGPDVDLPQVLRLYDQVRYLDAYELTRSWWSRSDVTDRMTVEQLVHAAKLGGRLGGQRLRRWLLRLARSHDATHPLVRYYVGSDTRGGHNFFADLQQFEDHPRLEGADADLEASWLANMAVSWSLLRDFDRAHELLAASERTAPIDAWVLCCRAWVLFHQDRWHEALDFADRSWQSRPAMPATAQVLGLILTRLGRLEELVHERLLEAARGGQSYETAQVTVAYLADLAERESGSARESLAADAWAILEDIETRLTPLADRQTKAQLAYMRADVAMTTGDRGRLSRYSQQARHPFYRLAHENLQKNPDGRLILLPYRPLLQKHNTCLPTSIAAAAGVFARQVDQDALAEALTYGGTAIWRAVDWLKANGWATRAFAVTPERASALIRAGIPFLLSTRRMGSAHATAVVGLDEAAGVLIIHDPSSSGWSRVLLEHVHSEEAPFGPQGVAMVPQDQAARLEVIDPDQCRAMEGMIEFTKLLETRGARSAAGLVESLLAQRDDEPLVQRLHAMYLDRIGERFAAIEIQQRLLERYPHSAAVQEEFLGSLEGTRDTARVLATLGQIVDRGRVAAVGDRQFWRYVPAAIITRYADYLGVTSEGFARARRLLLKAVRYEPAAAGAYHVLGDICIWQNQADQSLLPFRLAACLEYEHDHYARSYADALRLAGRESEALEWLHRRCQRLGGLVRGGWAWRTWVMALEDYGRADEAIAAMLAAQQHSDAGGEVHSFAAEFWVRMGDWDRAWAALECASRAGHRGLYLSAAVYLHEASGQWEQALELSGQWMTEESENAQARTAYLRQYAVAHGRKACVELAAQWLGQRQNHEMFEQIYLEQLRADFQDEAYTQVLRRRVQRNPLDAWAWRELGYSLLNEASQRKGAAAAALFDEVDAIVRRVQGLAAHDATTMILTAQAAQARGLHAPAAEMLLQAVTTDPGNGYCYDRIWMCVDHLAPDVVERIRARLCQQILRTIGPLHHARILAFRLAEQFGCQQAQQCVEEWLSRDASDPEVIEAQVDLWLTYGRGRSDAARAVEVLEEAIRRFPNHFDLRFSLADAYRSLLQEDKEIAVLREIIRRQPVNLAARANLASVLERRGQRDEAFDILRQSVRLRPDAQDAWGYLADMQWNAQQYDQALQTCIDGLAKTPLSVELRRRAIDFALELQHHHQALDLARQATALMENGAYFWYLLGDALLRCEVNNDLVEAENALNKALEYNAALFDAADRLATLLAQTRRCDQARQLIAEQRQLDGPPAAIAARLAWITWVQEKPQQAIDEMAQVVAQWPTHKWAWEQLMDWMENQQSWTRAREILHSVHPVIMEDPRLAARRLLLLEAAGVTSDELDSQWDQLLQDFPRHEAVHIWRFDQLLKRGSLDRAQGVITAIERFYPQSTYLLARKVQCFAEAGQWDLALDTACRVWQAPGEDEVWPEQTAWEAFEKHRRAPMAAQALFDRVLSNRRVRRAAMVKLTAAVALVKVPTPLALRLRQALGLAPSASARKLLMLLEGLDRGGWDNGACKAQVLEVLHDTHSRPAAMKYWRDHKDSCRHQTPVWQKIGYMLSCSKPPAAAEIRRWMCDWREHDGIEMWAIANYSSSLRKAKGVKEDLEELYATSRDVLQHLRGDQTMRFQAIVLCETTLRLGRIDEFLAAVRTHRALLEDYSAEHWTPPLATHLSKMLLLFADLIEGKAADARSRKALTAKAKAQAKLIGKSWPMVCWKRALAGALGRQTPLD
ncbi:MAG: tetratricopeptide repeat protein [Planctomycetaceae bacterium]|nr:tetratricopeptide repeat protein [Planctomycetaceae bacterium]